MAIYNAIAAVGTDYGIDPDIRHLEIDMLEKTHP